MSDAEHAELVRREQDARASGYLRNDYTCAVCGETFLDWPAMYDTYRNKAYCVTHAVFTDAPKNAETENPDSAILRRELTMLRRQFNQRLDAIEKLIDRHAD